MSVAGDRQSGVRARDAEDHRWQWVCCPIPPGRWCLLRRPPIPLRVTSTRLPGLLARIALATRRRRSRPDRDVCGAAGGLRLRTGFLPDLFSAWTMARSRSRTGMVWVFASSVLAVLPRGRPPAGSVLQCPLPRPAGRSSPHRLSRLGPRVHAIVDDTRADRAAPRSLLYSRAKYRSLGVLRPRWRG